VDPFRYREDRLYAEDVDCEAIARQFGTPCYVYSRAAIEAGWSEWDAALAGRRHMVCYAVKANSNLAVLGVLARLGSGFDIVSGGELARVMAAGGDPARVIFSGVGKRADEILFALEHSIRCFNVESVAELERINDLAREVDRRAPIALRVNPDVDANTHPYIATGLSENKFGIPVDNALEIYERAAGMSHVDVVGAGCHIGSQLIDLSPYAEAIGRMMELIVRLETRGITIDHLDIGGGLGIRYRDEKQPSPAALVEAVAGRIEGHDLELLVEPGRSIVGNAGVLLTRIEYLKANGARHFAVVDAAMTELLRPSLYSAWHDIDPLEISTDGQCQSYDIVGPVCETGDFLGKDRELCLSEGEFLAVRSAGAYGFVMSSNYNSRPRPAEVMVDGGEIYEVRQRETVAGLFAAERMLPD